MNRFVFLTVAILSATTVLADDEPCCAYSAPVETKASCAKTFATLDLTAEQRAKMEKLAADCDKTGCSKEGMATMEKAAKDVLTEDQFVAWKTACGAEPAGKMKS